MQSLKTRSLSLSVGILVSMLLISCLDGAGFGPEISYRSHGIENNCGFGVQPPGQIYYVSPEGSDTDPGRSIANPWQTVDRVNRQSLGPCDRVLFKGGSTYKGNLIFAPPRCNGQPGRPVQISSYGSGRATIAAGGGTGIYSHNCEAIEISNISLQGSGVSTNTGHGIWLYNSLSGNVKLSHVKIDSVEAQGFRRGGITISGLGGRSGYRDVEITRSQLHDNGQHGIGSRGAFFADVPGYAHENFYLAYNRVYRNRGDPTEKTSHTGDGIVLGSVDNGIIEHNIAHHNGGLNVHEGGGPVGIWTWDSNKIVIQFNESHHNKSGSDVDGGGFDFDGGTTHSVMQYNYSHDNEGPGFLIYEFEYARPMKGNVIRYNISENDSRKYGAGILFNSGQQCPNWRLPSQLDCTWSTVEGITIYNNTIFSSATMGKKGAVFRASGTAHDNILVSNNLFIGTDAEFPILHVEGQTSGLIFLGNNYYQQEGSVRFYYQGSEYDNLEKWRLETGQEMLDQSAVGFSTNPRLIGPGRAGTVGKFESPTQLRVYFLEPGSPMIDAGLDLEEQFKLDTGKHDFFGTPVPRGQTYDLGAHEFAEESRHAVRP